MSKVRFHICLFLIINLLWPITSFGQAEKYTVPASLNNSTWIEFMDHTTEVLIVKYYVQADSMPEFRMEIASDSLSLITVLKMNLEPLGFHVATDGHSTFFITEGISIKTQLPVGFFNRVDAKALADQQMFQQKSSDGQLTTSNVYVAKTIVIGNRDRRKQQKKCKLSGIVTNAFDGQPIIGGTIYVNELKTGTATDENGYYQLELLPEKYTLTFRSLESIERMVKIDMQSSGTLNLTLDQNLYLLQEVEVKSSQNDNIRGTQMGFEKISGKMIKEIPVVLGEQDIIKVALLLPGVNTIGEGAAGFNVRGSSADQNLFYIENTPVYNTSHLFGFFSAFNPDIIDNFTLYKGSIPARFGGRLSSIFDITTKTGNMEQFSARGGISPITARLMVEGPILKNKVSYIAGIRSTYSDWVLQMVKDPEIRDSKAYFGDVVLGFDARINTKNKLKLFGYYSEDRIKLANSTNYEFKNQGASIDWLHGFKHKHDLNLRFVYSDYEFEEQNSELEIAAYKQNYRLNHNEVNLDLHLRPNDKHTINTGVSGILYMLDRGAHLPLNDLSIVTPIDFGTEKAIESALYLSDEWKISPLVTLLGGLRYNLYSYLGPQTVYNYLPNAPLSPTTIVDTIHFGNNKPIKTYGGLDYRLSAIFILNPNLSLKAGYNRLHQYIFMLSNTIALSPTDTWKLADYNIKPMIGDQFSAGVYANFGKNFEGSVEGYYKIVNNLVEYKDGANLLTSKIVEWDVLQGKLNAYGIEMMIKKPFGKLNGWINYTYSNSSVLVDNKITGEIINFGQRYSSNYEHPHTLNVVANFKVSRRFILSGNLIYSSGRPITYPTAIYYLDGQKILHYSQRNEYRIPDYFRIDLALKIEGNLLSKKLAHGNFIFSVYNLTGRKNAYSVYFKSEDGKINGYKMSIFGTQIFSITYDFKLGNYAD
ncbi:MAG: TonB-dependent receptor [Bacteroidetes bacterium]|nr:TonB-dependent receptor [Bacteroidota bacterium]